MSWLANLRRFFFPAALAFVLLGAHTPGSARVTLPVLPQAEGEQCVEPTDFMRRNHMELLKHQRDETMYRGIRTQRHSLRECINCHAADFGQDAQPEQHFCVSCHKFSAVKPDCFQRHRMTPETADPR